MSTQNILYGFCTKNGSNLYLHNHFPTSLYPLNWKRLFCYCHSYRQNQNVGKHDARIYLYPVSMEAAQFIAQFTINRNITGKTVAIMCFRSVLGGNVKRTQVCHRFNTVSFQFNKQTLKKDGSSRDFQEKQQFFYCYDVKLVTRENLFGAMQNHFQKGSIYNHF